MPSQAATFAEDSEDENDQNDSPASRASTAMNSAGALRADLPRVRTSGTPRPMVFGTRPVFCGRMPSQAVTAESDHEDDDSDATIRGGALIDYNSDFKDEVEQSLRDGSLRGGSLSSANFHIEDEDKEEILVAVRELAEPSGQHTDAHEISSATSDSRADRNDDAKSELSSGVSSIQPMRCGSGYDIEERWVWVELTPSTFTETSTNKKDEPSWVDRQILSRRNSISDRMGREYQTLNDDVVSEDEKVASVCPIYSYEIGRAHV